MFSTHLSILHPKEFIDSASGPAEVCLVCDNCLRLLSNRLAFVLYIALVVATSCMVVITC